jgi:hypothetical protein
MLKTLLTNLFRPHPTIHQPKRIDPVEYYCGLCGKKQFFPLKQVDQMWELDDLDPFAPPKFDCPDCQDHTMLPVFYQDPDGGITASKEYAQQHPDLFPGIETLND